MFQNKNYRRWFMQGTLGIVIFGFGLCMFSEAAFFKQTEPPLWEWVAFGTTSLVVLMTGLVVMVDSVRWRIKYEQEK